MHKSAHQKRDEKSERRSSRRSWKKLLIDPTDDDDEIDIDDYEDVRCEIQATGYHLVRLSFYSLVILFDILFLFLHRHQS